MRSIFNSKIGIFIVLLFLSFFSCSSKKNKAGFSKGQIVYSVDMDNFNSPYTVVCPETFKLSYSSQGFGVESSVLMGLMDAKMLHTYSSPIVNMLMGLYGNGQYTSFDMNTLSGRINGMNFEKIKSGEKVMGYKCDCLEYSDPLKQLRVRLYYSDSFDGKVSKALFPGVGIDGMVLKFELKCKQGSLVIKAKEFSDKTVGGDYFKIPSSYSKTSKEEIMAIIRDMSK